MKIVATLKFEVSDLTDSNGDSCTETLKRNGWDFGLLAMTCFSALIAGEQSVFAIKYDAELHDASEVMGNDEDGHPLIWAYDVFSEDDGVVAGPIYFMVGEQTFEHETVE